MQDALSLSPRAIRWIDDRAVALGLDGGIDSRAVCCSRVIHQAMEDIDMRFGADYHAALASLPVVQAAAMSGDPDLVTVRGPMFFAREHHLHLVMLCAIGTAQSERAGGREARLGEILRAIVMQACDTATASG